MLQEDTVVRIRFREEKDSQTAHHALQKEPGVVTRGWELGERNALSADV